MTESKKLDRPILQTSLDHPAPTDSECCSAPTEDLSFSIGEDIQLYCRFYCAAPDAPTIVYFYGWNESSDLLDLLATYFTASGINVFLTARRGFGRSEGTVSLSTLVSDSEPQFSQAIEWLQAKGYSGAVVVMGRSLGVIPALEVVQNSQAMIKAMILESAFCSIIPFLDTICPHLSVDGMLEEDCLSTLKKISKIKIPTMIFHGSRDGVVPVAQAEKLQAASAARNKQFLIIPGAEHNTVWQVGGKLYFQTIKGFIDTVCGINTWRQRRKKLKDTPRGEAS
ncbi:MAG: lysophospholipase [Desulforhopalus sp.]|nr:lysophospholipase [Desulforhopalus sp.]